MDPTQTVPWYKSIIIRHALVAFLVILAKVVMRLGHLEKYAPYADEQTIADLVNSGLDLIGALILAGIVHARWTGPLPPLAITQKRADAANLTPPEQKP